MPTLAATLKLEIRRLAAREAKRLLRPLRRAQKQIKALKLVSAGHKRGFASLERRLGRLVARVRPGKSARRLPNGEPRLAPKEIRKLRGPFTRLEFSRRLGVSTGSIFGWETGRTIPRGRSNALLLALKNKAANATKGGRGARPAAKKRAGARGRGRR
jgi:DNA-binding transcriptional regulator YiaG